MTCPAAFASPTTVAVIGTGAIAKQHLACLKEIPTVAVTAVCDLSRAMAESAASRFNVPRFFTDYRTLLAELKPDVVHITTPPTSHYRLAKDALAAGCHVLVEKPATVEYSELQDLLACARTHHRHLIEDYNYVFNDPVQKVLGLIDSGDFGQVTHVDVSLCLDILGKGNPFTDPNAPHPCLSMAGGAIADFLPHLASLAHAFVGPHRTAHTIYSKRAQTVLPSDEFRALIDAERGTASLLFSSHTQPDAFQLRVYGTKMRASINLFESRLTLDRLRNCAKPLIPLFNGLEESRVTRRASVAGLIRKLSGGPGAYEGLFQLLRRTYASLAAGTPLPVSLIQIDDVNRLVNDLKPSKEPFSESPRDGSQRLPGTPRRFGVPSARPRRPGTDSPRDGETPATAQPPASGTLPSRPAHPPQPA